MSSDVERQQRQLVISLRKNHEGDVALDIKVSGGGQTKEFCSDVPSQGKGNKRNALRMCSLIAACAIDPQKRIEYDRIKFLSGCLQLNGKPLGNRSIDQYVRHFNRIEFKSSDNGPIYIQRGIGVALSKDIETAPLSPGEEEKIQTWLNFPDRRCIDKPQVSVVEADSIKKLSTQEIGSPSRSRIPFSLSQLPSTGPNCFGREKELSELHAAWEGRSTTVVYLVGWGGVGKTALLNKWLGELRRKDPEYGRAQALAWLFAGQGASSEDRASDEEFISEALKHFRGAPEQSQSVTGRAMQLAQLMRHPRRRTLLILDGLEALQNREGHLGHTATGILLGELAGKMNGLCIVATRPPFAHREHWKNSSVCEIPLDNLSPEASVSLLKSLEVVGDESELIAAAREYGYHALTLTLLGALLVKKHKGQVRSRDRISLTDDELREGEQVKFVMRRYDEILNDLELSIMSILSLFDRTVPQQWLSDFIEKPAIAGVSDQLYKISDARWNAAIRSLRKARLLNVRPGIYESFEIHRFVRTHYANRFAQNNPSGFRRAHGRLYEFFLERAKPDVDVQTLSDLEPLYQAIWHGTQAGRYQDAFSVYWNRIRRGDENFSYEKLGAVGSDLGALSCFFESRWSYPVRELSDKDQLAILSEVSLPLKAFGRMSEAIDAIRAALAMCEAAEDWAGAASELADLSIIVRQHNLVEALKLIQKAIEYRHKGNDAVKLAASSTGRAFTLHLLGRAIEAGAEFEQIILILGRLNLPQCVNDTNVVKIPVGCNLIAYRICQYWLDLGEVSSAYDMAQQWLVKAREGEKKLSIAYHQVTLARVYQAQGNHDEAGQWFNRAIEQLYSANRDDQLMEGLLYRAGYFLDIRDTEQAKLDIEKVRQFAQSTQHHLLNCDAVLLAARLASLEGNYAASRCYRAEAKELMESIGYYLRRQECSSNFDEPETAGAQVSFDSSAHPRI